MTHISVLEALNNIEKNIQEAFEQDIKRRKEAEAEARKQKHLVDLVWNKMSEEDRFQYMINMSCFIPIDRYTAGYSTDTINKNKEIILKYMSEKDLKYHLINGYSLL